MAPTRLTPAEMRCYTLLSELFLDTLVTPFDHFIIAKNLRTLGLSIDSIEHMLLYEVFPVLWPNFMLIIGEWVGWDEDWLASQAEKIRENPGNLLYRGCMWLLRSYFCRICITEHWNGIKEWLLLDKDDKVWDDEDHLDHLINIDREMAKAQRADTQKRMGGEDKWDS